MREIEEDLKWYGDIYTGMKNIKLVNDTAISGNKCTMCYRCINKCPKQAITLLGKKVIEQHDINQYL